MWSSRALAAALALGMAGCAAQPAPPVPVCPVRSAPLRYLDVFDGAPAELATLVPEVDSETSGHWLLGYVYDAGRTVTVRCKYADRSEVDVPLPRRVNRCDYRTRPGQALSLVCG